MEIHGSDIIVEHEGYVDPQKIIETIKSFWKNLVIEDDGTESGFFVYENQEAKESWDNKGWSEDNDKRMIYVIVREGRDIAFVIDDKKENLNIIKEVKKSIMKIN